MHLPQSDYLKDTIDHLDPKSFDAVPIIEGMEKMAFQARNLARASKIFNQMVVEKDCMNILTLAGSLISAGLKKVLTTLIETNMIDCIVSTGANMVDMDFFEGLGFRHYIGDPKADDHELQQRFIDRIYDTYISEYELRVCDATVSLVADRLPPKPHSSREFMAALGAYLSEQDLGKDSLLRLCYEKQVPIFVPSLSDCSAGFGLTFHQQKRPTSYMTHDSVHDFSELTKLVSDAKTTGIFMVGGGVPKNFTADTVVCAETLGLPIKMHKYAIQLTVADERDGALSGSTLKEAHSWGKVDQGAEQMVFSEATLSMPLLVSYAYHKGAWKARKERRLNRSFPTVTLLSEDAKSPGLMETMKAKKELKQALVAGKK
ncbi:TPA: deoxyhypusine synthase [Candidatus Peribacteria bacterium]|nr:MAG: deoxyhypusine synthase [Candidatus Peribacteria bacterium RIFOXYD2_FULL_58_15]HAS33974.1 deoxyhypusine synthase [Candidatus Peribacteria bacterium]